MPNYIFAYHQGKQPETPEAGAESMERWNAWVAGLGDAMVNPGTPLGKSRIVSASSVSENGGPSPLIGFSVVRADSLEAALSLAAGCPYLEMGTIEVAEMREMQR